MSTGGLKLDGVKGFLLTFHYRPADGVDNGQESGHSSNMAMEDIEGRKVPAGEPQEYIVSPRK